MIDPGTATLIGTGISAVSSLLGGKKSKDSAKEQAYLNYLAQKEFATHGVRWRVEDAKAAGLHPLFALGGSGAAFSPNPIVPSDGGLEAAGQSAARGITAALNTFERELAQAQLKGLEAKAESDFAQASYWRSEASRNAQNNTSVAPQPIVWPSGAVSYPYDTSQPVGGGLAPSPSFWGDFRLGQTPAGHDLSIRLPNADDAGQALEALSESPVMFASVVTHNADVFGKRWITDMAHHLGYPNAWSWIKSQLSQWDEMATQAVRERLWSFIN